MTLRIALLFAILLTAGCTTRSEKGINSDKDRPKASSIKRL